MEKLRLTIKEQSDILHQVAEELRYSNNYSRLAIKPKLELTPEEMKNIQYPTLLIEADAYMKMFMLVDSTEKEISWHGLIERNKEQNTYRLYDLVMFPQHNTAAHTGTDDDEYMHWLQNKLTDENFPMQDLRMHGHSHVRMTTQASATDDIYQASMISDIEDGDYYVFLIVNKKRQMNLYIYDYNQQIMFTEKETRIEIVNNGHSLLEWTRNNMKKYVNETSHDYITTNRKGKKHGNRS